MTTAERNREAKKRLVKEFGKGNVTVSGGRGTAYGWFHANISIPMPTDCYGVQFHETNSHWRSCDPCRSAYETANETATKALDGLKFGSFYADDGYGTRYSNININIRFDYPNQNRKE
jgi:hypothetical protein